MLKHIIGVLLLVAVFLLGAYWQATNSVCHAKTEDSVITDCDYRNGGWYRK